MCCCSARTHTFAAYHLFLRGASEALQEDKIQYPAGMCQGILKMATEAEDGHIQENEIEFRDVITAVALAMQKREGVILSEVQEHPSKERAEEMMKNSLEMAEAIQLRFPDLISEDTMKIFTEAQNWYL